VTTLFDTQTPAAGLSPHPAAGPTLLAPLVAGIDVSLTGTAVAVLGGTTRIATKGRRRDPLPVRHSRLQAIARQALEAIGVVHLAVIEGPSHHSVGGSPWDRGGLWWLIVDGLLDREIPTAVVPPACRAKYATGSGAGRKAGVLAAVASTYGVTGITDDEADAIVLRAAGLDWAGHPLAVLPESHRGALLSCEWPGREAVSR
jgi:hypothetical protein